MLLPVGCSVIPWCACRPNVNFIHGENGSGKSAILQAIQIVLGLSAKATNRVAKMDEFIAYGAHEAVISITM